MNADALNDLWNSAPNRPPADAGARLAADFVARLQRRRRVQAWWLAWTFLALTVVTGVVVTQLVTRGAAGVAGQWALWPMLVLPWGAAFVFLRQFRRESAVNEAARSSLRVTLLTAQAANRSERRRLAAIGALQSAAVPLSAIAIRQLYLSGKATVDQAWSMALVFGLALAVGGGVVFWRYRQHLVPERRKIESLLRDLELPESS